jgi:hypothetical protein
MPGAVASARAALDAARAPCVGRALAAALEMLAHAAMGDAASAAAAMETAERIHGAPAGTALAASAFGYAESQLRGRALLGALTPAQRSSRAARELGAMLHDTTRSSPSC